MNDIHHVLPLFTSPIRSLLSSGTRCYGFPVAGSIDVTLGPRNEIIDRGTRIAVLNMAHRLRPRCREGIQPAEDRVSLKANQAMDFPAGDLALRSPEIERGGLDMEPG